jgi:hypothetical protein
LCGTAEWEWEANKRAYAPAERFCMGCYLKAIASHDVADNPGASVVLKPTTGRDAAKRLLQEKAKFLAAKRSSVE